MAAPTVAVVMGRTGPALRRSRLAVPGGLSLLSEGRPWYLLERRRAGTSGGACGPR
jgi:hypothetical protein